MLDVTYPVVKPEYPLLTVLYLLRIKDLDAVPLSLENQADGRGRAIFGFSSLAKLVSGSSSGFSTLLNSPCVSASDPLPVFDHRDSIDEVLAAYARRRLGVALIHDSSERKTKKSGGRSEQSLLTLADFLDLMRKEKLVTQMKVSDVATPLLAVSSRTTIRAALRTMFKHRYRRVFLDDERTYVSDRDIMDRVFRPDAIDSLESTSRDILAAPIGKLGRRRSPGAVSSNANLGEAAMKLDGDHTSCLLTTLDTVVTPWDIIMKPWIAKSLEIVN